MTASRCSRSLAVAALLSCSRALADAESELSVRLGTHNLVGGEDVPGAAPWRFVASSEPAHESRVRFSVRLDEPGYWPGVSTSALLRVEAPLSTGAMTQPLLVRDASSSIAVSLRLTPDAELELRAFPFDTDYWRLGYLHALDWGGTNVTARESVFLNQRGGAPGGRLAFRSSRVNLFTGVKWAAAPAEPESKRLWGLLAGVRLDPVRAWRFEAGFGYFVRPELGPGLGTSELLEGASLRAIWRRGADEPELPVEPFRRASFAQEAFGLRPREVEGEALAVEGTALVQRHPALEAAVSRLVAAPAAALYGSTRRSKWHAHVAFTWRSLRFVLRNERSVLPAASSAMLEQAELSAWLGGTVTFPRLQLTPGLELGVVSPAALQTPSRSREATQCFVAGPSGLLPLPPGASPLPLAAARASLRWQASPSVALVALADYARDPNLTRLGSSAERRFVGPDSLTVEGGALARF